MVSNAEKFEILVLIFPCRISFFCLFDTFISKSCRKIVNVLKSLYVTPPPCICSLSYPLLISEQLQISEQLITKSNQQTIYKTNIHDIPRLQQVFVKECIIFVSRTMQKNVYGPVLFKQFVKSTKCTQYMKPLTFLMHVCINLVIKHVFLSLQ